MALVLTVFILWTEPETMGHPLALEIMDKLRTKGLS